MGQCAVRLLVTACALLAFCRPSMGVGVSRFWHRVDLDAGKAIKTCEGYVPHPAQTSGRWYPKVGQISGDARYEVNDRGPRAVRWPEETTLWEFAAEPGWGRLLLADRCVLYQTDAKITALDKATGTKLYELSRDGGFGIWWDSAPGPPDLLYLIAGTRPSFRVRALSLKTGRTRWETELTNLPVRRDSSGRTSVCEPHSLIGQVLRFWDSPVVWLLDLETGRKVAELSASSSDRRDWLNWFRCLGTVLVTATRTFDPKEPDRGPGRDVLRGVDIASGKLLWQKDDGTRTTSHVQEVGGKLAVFSEKGNLRLLDPQTGKDEWAPLPTEQWPVWTATDAAGDLYLKTRAWLYRIDIRAPGIRWQAPVGHPGHGIAALPVLLPSRLLDWRVRTSGRGQTTKWVVSLVVRNLKSGSIEREFDIQTYTGFADTLGVHIEPVGDRFANVATAFIIFER